MRAFVICACAGGILAWTAGWAGAAIVNLTPVADAFVDSAQPTNNYGGAGSVGVAAAGLPAGEFQSVLRFDTSSAFSSFNSTFGVGQWTVQSVTLRMTAAAPNNAIFNSPNAAGQFAASWMQNDSWVEGTGTPAAPTTTGITFATLPSFLSGSDEALGTFAFNGATSGSVTFTLSLTSLFTADVSSGGLVSLRLAAADSAIVALWNSRSFGTASARPELGITATPAPSSAIGLLGAVGVLGARRRRADATRQTRNGVPDDEPATVRVDRSGDCLGRGGRPGR